VLMAAIPKTAAMAWVDSTDAPNEPENIARGAIMMAEQISMPVEVTMGGSCLNRLPKMPARLYEIVAPMTAISPSPRQLNPFCSSGDIIRNTPQNPIKTPTIFRLFRCSSDVKKWASSTVKMGVAAFNIDATPLSIRVCPHTIRLKGIALFRAPITKYAPQVFRPVGIR